MNEQTKFWIHINIRGLRIMETIFSLHLRVKRTIWSLPERVKDHCRATERSNLDENRVDSDLVRRTLVTFYYYYSIKVYGRSRQANNTSSLDKAVSSCLN